jgi:ATP-dependent Lon protease
MSEALKKVAGIKHLPVFPLPLVLLPNELLPLHIFEERYQKMLKDVESDRRFFGVTHFEPGDSLTEKPAKGTVGCVAEVRENQPLPDGRSNVITVGVVRYHLVEYVDAGEPYLIGDVEFFEDDAEEQSALHELSDDVHTLFERVAKAAFKLSDNRGAFPEIPKTDPEQLSFLITAAFNLDNELKYKLLETHSTTDRLSKLKEILEQTVNKMEESADIHKISQTNGHTNKKLDI